VLAIINRVEAVCSTCRVRSATPDFIGGFVPESTMGEQTVNKQVVSVEVLRATKPDFTGGYVPEATIGGQAFATDVEFPLYDQEPNLYAP
jgi:hypothetical protein